MTHDTHAAIASEFSLTPTETRVAAVIARGMGAKRAGQELGLTYNTTRFHLKSIFSKTGVNRQSALVVLFLTPRVTACK